ncbi:hypothetical protein G6F59_018159 [Rhizopus arrhizus]|nr:hypothetical protein G6F59_018159 [Rhizopus arrhizus]
MPAWVASAWPLAMAAPSGRSARTGLSAQAIGLSSRPSSNSGRTISVFIRMGAPHRVRGDRAAAGAAWPAAGLPFPRSPGPDRCIRPGRRPRTVARRNDPRIRCSAQGRSRRWFHPSQWPGSGRPARIRRS